MQVPLHAVAAVGLFAMAGCAPSDTVPGTLSGACQLRPCVCADPNTPWWHETITAPVQWRQGGQAFCPPGYVLQRVEKKKGKN